MKDKVIKFHFDSIPWLHPICFEFKYCPKVQICILKGGYKADILSAIEQILLPTSH